MPSEYKIEDVMVHVVKLLDMHALDLIYLPAGVGCYVTVTLYIF